MVGGNAGSERIAIAGVSRPETSLRAGLHRPLTMLLAGLMLVSGLLPACNTPNAPPSPGQAHAHNDYRHERPLLDALDHGFTSVEADVYLVDGRLLVAHEAYEVDPSRTLQSLYLDPLCVRTEQNDGWVFPDKTQLMLLIDVKTEADETYRALREVLQEYEDILTVFRPDGREEGAVTVIISGNRARELLAQENIRYAAIDGRLQDLDSGDPATLIPLISDKWSDHFFWRGDGDMPESERQKLRDIVATAHEQERRVRFWSTPDIAPQRDAVWQELLNAKVDLINTDDLAGLQNFLQEHSGRSGE